MAKKPQQTSTAVAKGGKTKPIKKSGNGAFGEKRGGRQTATGIVIPPKPATPPPPPPAPKS